MSKRPVDPVKPSGMDVIFFYHCPFCRHEIPAVSPTIPGLMFCEVCRQRFPIVPIDEQSIMFIKLMLQDGKAAIDSDYM